MTDLLPRRREIKCVVLEGGRDGVALPDDCEQVLSASWRENAYEPHRWRDVWLVTYVASVAHMP